MGDNLTAALTAIAVGIIGVATLSVILSRQANTAGVLQAGGNALAADINAAVSPLNGVGGGSSGYQPALYTPNMGGSWGFASGVA